MTSINKDEIGTGLGTKLKYWDSDGSKYEPISNVNTIDWDGPSRNTVEVGGLNPQDEYVRKLQGVLNAGSISANIQYSFSQYDTLKTQEESRGNYHYLVELPDGAGLEWEGYIESLPISIAEDAVMNGDVSFAVDGKVDFVSAPATSSGELP